MTTTRTAALAALLCLGACRCGLFAPGLGHGVEGAEGDGDRTEAQALASLARVGVGRGGRGATAPIVSVRGGKAVVLVLGGGLRRDELPQALAEFTTDQGERFTSGGAVVVGELPGEGRVQLLAFDVGEAQLRPVAVARTGSPVGTGALRAVTLREKGPPMIREVTARGALDSAASGFEGKVPANPEGAGAAALFDASTWRLVGVGAAWGGDSGELRGFGAAWLLRRLAGRPSSVRLEVAGGPEACRVTAHVAVRDGASTLREAALVVGEPEVAFAIPDLEHDRKNESEDATSQVVPVGKKLAARAPFAGETLELSAELKGCEGARFAQVILLGDHQRWLSWPYRLPAPGGPPVRLATGDRAWRIDGVPASAPLVWTGTPAPPPPEASPEAGCRPPLARLDPDVPWIVGKRSPDTTCLDGLLVFPVDEEERARCAQPAAYLGIAADGWPVYASSGGWSADVLRRAHPDRNAPAPDGPCRLVTPRLNDDVLAANPCGRDVFGDARPPEAVFFAAEGELAFACQGGVYRKPDGSLLDLRGGALLRLGAGDHALVLLPWGSLGVLRPDGTGQEVGGLPMGSRLDRPLPTAATDDGFLVAVETASGGEAWREPELFHVSLAGQATSRGRFGPLDGGSSRRYLDASGALYTITEGHAGDGPRLSINPIRRYVAGGKAQVIYEPRHGGQRLSDAGLLFGWRSAGPEKPGPPGRLPHQPGPVETPAVETYAAADPAGLPCRPSLELEPGRVYLRLDNKLVDPADLTRARWLPANATILMGGDGRLVQVSFEHGEPKEVHLVPDPVAALRPTWDGQSCVRFPGYRGPLAAVPGGTCGGPPIKDWVPVPGSDAVVTGCPAPGSFQERLVGNRLVPASRPLRHAGMNGRVLLGSRADWSVVDPGGREQRITGLPEEVRAIRAVQAGFAVVAPAARAKQKNVFDLLLVTDDGRVRRIGGYGGLPPEANIVSSALDAELAFHVVAYLPGGAGRSALYRIPNGGGEAEIIWQQQAWASSVALLTGP